jgi:hypothetical protein
MSLDSLNKKSRRLFTSYLSLALARNWCRSWLPQAYGWTASSGADLAVLQRTRGPHAKLLDLNGKINFLDTGSAVLGQIRVY